MHAVMYRSDIEEPDEPRPEELLVANGRTLFLRIVTDEGYVDHRVVSPCEVRWAEPEESA